jgi:hypothetical protein
MGLSSACIIFTIVMKIPLSILRRDHSILCSGYLDDSLYVHQDMCQLSHDVSVAAQLLQNV